MSTKNHGRHRRRQKMQAIVKEKPEQGVALRNVPVPTPLDDEVLVRVKATGICGTDVHIYDWDRLESAKDTASGCHRTRVCRRDRGTGTVGSSCTGGASGSAPRGILPAGGASSAVQDRDISAVTCVSSVWIATGVSPSISA